MKTRVYIAGPISKGDIFANIDQARDAGKRLIRAGYSPLVPHLTCYMDGDYPNAAAGGFTADEWYGVDFPWVLCSDAVLRLPGESVGADMETQLADKHGIPVYHDVEKLLAEVSPAFGLML